MKPSARSPPAQLFCASFFGEKACGMVDEIDVSAQEVVARHLVAVVWRHAEILDLVAGLRTNPHGAAICNPQLGPVGEFLRKRLRPLEIATQIGIGARARTAAAGRLVDPEDYSAVVLKAGQEVFSRAVAERVGDDDDRPLVNGPG